MFFLNQLMEKKIGRGWHCVPRTLKEMRDE